MGLIIARLERRRRRLDRRERERPLSGVASISNIAASCA